MTAYTPTGTYTVNPCCLTNVIFTRLNTGYAIVRDDPVIGEIAKKYKAKPAQVILAWHLSRGVHVVPRSANSDHQLENLHVRLCSLLDVYLVSHMALSDDIQVPTLHLEDLERISALNKNQRLCNPIRDGLVNGWTAERMGWDY